MDKKIKWGIIGPGRIAQQFAHDIPYSSYGELYAVASRELNRAQAFAKNYNIPVAYGSYKELLSDPLVDVVYVAVPHAFHYDVVMQVLNAGKAVLCEKPLTIASEQCSTLLATAKAKNLYLMEGMWSYFLPPIIKAKEWLEQGNIGQLMHLQCDFGWVQEKNKEDRWYNPALAGGALWDMGCYNLAMAELFIGKSPERTEVLAQIADTGVDEEITLLLKYDDCDAILQTSFLVRYPNVCRLVGTEGYIEINDFWSSKKATLYLNDGKTETFEDNRSSFGFNYEADAVALDIMEGRKESSVVSFAYSEKIIAQMASILVIAKNK